MGKCVCVCMCLHFINLNGNDRQHFQIWYAETLYFAVAAHDEVFVDDATKQVEMLLYAETDFRIA